MEVIPVIDIRHGVVVRAVAGRRADYRPLAGMSAPIAVARRLCAVHPFRALYIADLDAIEGRPDNREIILAIVSEPDFDQPKSPSNIPPRTSTLPVLGSCHSRPNNQLAYCT
jgi:phosphoribosylformimino-5-aminoimidazole carboxamide ribonucleotide (ProFAR) isomerase